jgi:hypothetical protein
LLAAFGSVVGGDGRGLAIAVGFDGGGVDALLHEVVADGLGAALGELLIVVVGADAIGVAFDGDMQTGISEYDAGNFGEALAGSGKKLEAAAAE